MKVCGVISLCFCFCNSLKIVFLKSMSCSSSAFYLPVSLSYLNSDSVNLIRLLPLRPRLSNYLFNICVHLNYFHLHRFPRRNQRTVDFCFVFIRSNYFFVSCPLGTASTSCPSLAAAAILDRAVSCLAVDILIVWILGFRLSYRRRPGFLVGPLKRVGACFLQFLNFFVFARYISFSFG